MFCKPSLIEKLCPTINPVSLATWFCCFKVKNVPFGSQVFNNLLVWFVVVAAWAVAACEKTVTCCYIFVVVAEYIYEYTFAVTKIILFNPWDINEAL